MNSRSGPLAALVFLALFAGCVGDRNEPGSSNGSDRTGAAPARTGRTDPGHASDEWFTDRAQETGLDFVHFNGASGEFYYPEILPPGVALFDYDNDGDLDVYVVQGQMLGNKSVSEALVPPAPGALPLRGRLYRNDLQVLPDGTRQLHFTDVTEQSGIDAHGYGIGVATGDIDNDGCVDLYLTNFGPSQLYHNNCDGTFTDITKQSGTGNQGGFGVSAAFLDYDRDGWLDLYVANNVTYSLKDGTKCPNMAGARDYCPPRTYARQPDRLYRNLGNGRFVDVTATALKGGRFGPALGVAVADYDGDGWPDIYVANDGRENLLWINQHNGTFKETALQSGVAVNAVGHADASMGVDAGDFDNDGDEDLIVTDLTGEGSNLFVNDGSGRFQDLNARSGLGRASLPYTGWGTAWFDFDNDGLLDILAVNGTIVALEGLLHNPFPYDQRKLLLRNLGNGQFKNVTDEAGAAFKLSEAGRGAAFGDVDNDGDVDVVVANDAGRLRLLINNIGNRNHWLGMRLVGERAPRDMLGAQVAVIRHDGSTLWRRARSDGSYASANDPRVLVGLGTSADRPEVRVRWPGGRVEAWSDMAVDRWLTLKEGSGKTASWPGRAQAAR
jgi:enediyne biosynthesis protein E4